MKAKTKIRLAISWIDYCYRSRRLPVSGQALGYVYFSNFVHEIEGLHSVNREKYLPLVYFNKYKAMEIRAKLITLLEHVGK